MPVRPLATSLPRHLALFLVGAVVGTIGDQIHVQFRVLSYPGGVPWLLGQAPWVPLIFGGAGLALVHGETLFDGLRPTGEPRATRLGCIVPVLLFYLAYLSTGLFQDSPRLLAAGLTAAWVLRIARRPSIDRVLGALVAATGGCLVEALLSSTGAFAYHTPDFLRLPLWLPALYFHVSLMTREIHLAWFTPAPRTLPGAATARV